MVTSSLGIGHEKPPAICSLMTPCESSVFVVSPPDDSSSSSSPPPGTHE